MWAPIKNLLSKSKTLGSLLGDIVFETPPLKGQSSHSIFQWQVKKGLDGKSLYVCVKLRPDGYAGPEGSPMNYSSFDLATALQIRADLDECIGIARHFAEIERPAV
jgi:hypothetical protein